MSNKLCLKKNYRSMQTQNRIIHYLGRHKRFVIIICAIVGLNAMYGFDARFTIINLLWILISVVKID